MGASSSSSLPRDAFDYYPRLTRVRDHVIRHLSESLTLREVAQIACLEEKYFSAFFRAKTGICFSHWLSGLRVRKAMEIIRIEDTRITEIALGVGFRDLRTFERAFKRHTGVTPRVFKRSVSTRIGAPSIPLDNRHEF